jgi:sugar-specific transcriptional regulator TrmB
MADITDKLTLFGLSPIEADIYLCLTNTTAATALELSRSLLVPRTNIYDHLEKLIERGLVERIIQYKSQQFRAFPLSILESDIIKRKQDITQLEESLQFLQKNIKQIVPESTKTQVRYYHGATGIRQMMWHALSATKEHVGYSILGRKEIVGEKFLREFIEEMKKRHIRDRVIINPGKERMQYIDATLNKRSAPLEHIKMLGQEILKITGDTTIYNHIFSVMYWKQNEIVGVEIENPELVAMQKNIFEILWKQAKPFTS